MKLTSKYRFTPSYTGQPSSSERLTHRPATNYKSTAKWSECINHGSWLCSVENKGRRRIVPAGNAWTSEGRFTWDRLDTAESIVDNGLGA
ncbi:hypothetical protein K443DRAFT_684837 [Laccaria amethystina LaAM-08-1]|uniref:Uncharacterized protein n=1 Tax=Laccaria amethystina LaAM-08-1 TaxID=1095629 RepID=A0A0C9WW89_9AGAR|nr:hypothetical protein K443DRAFT_684837 [Laccaria amethystina LaAM-08-1]